ncbi:hypothetical protein AYI68_g188, partial [Smittium mucronatum]
MGPRSRNKKFWKLDKTSSPVPSSANRLPGNRKNPN